MDPVSLLFGVVIGIGLMACVASRRPVPPEPRRDARGRFMKGPRRAPSATRAE